MATYARKAVYGALTVLMLSLASAIAAYLLRFLLARRLTIEHYGLFFALLAFIGLLNLFKDLGLGYALLKFIPEAQVARNYARIKSMIASCFVVQAASSGIITIALLLFAPAIMQKFFHSQLTGLFVIFAAAFFASFAQNIVMVCFQGFQRMFLFSVQDLARNLTVVIIAWLLLSLGLGIFAPAWAYLIMYVIVFLVFFRIFTAKVFRRFFSLRARYSGELFGKLIFFGFPAMLTIFGSNLLQYTDTLLLTYFTDLAKVGLYQAAVPLAALVLYLAHAASAITTPLISELVALKKRGELRHGIEMLHKYLFIIAAPASAVLIAFPDIFLRLFFGEKFIGAAPALMVLAVGVIFYTVAYVNVTALFGLNRPKQTTKIMLLTALLNFLLNLALIPHYGIIGAASATTFSYLFMLVLSAVLIRKAVKIKEPFAMWARVLVLCLAPLLLCLRLVKGVLVLNPWVELAVTVLIGGLVYCALLLLFRVVTTSELKWLKSQLFRSTT